MLLTVVIREAWLLPKTIKGDEADITFHIAHVFVGWSCKRFIEDVRGPK